jgi:hypothetical protein
MRDKKMTMIRVTRSTQAITCIACLLLGRALALSSERPSRRDLLAGVAATSSAAAISLLSNNNIQVANAQETVAAATAATVVPKVRLGNGSLIVSRTIQGYWQLAGGHGRYKEADAIDNMQAHYNAGITTLDTADIYGPSEIIIGKFIQQKPPEAVPNTKFCCYRFLDDITRAEVKERILRSCERLQVSKLPLVQFFWSNYDIKRYIDVALYLTELKEEGLIQEIGATNSIWNDSRN